MATGEVVSHIPSRIYIFILAFIMLSTHQFVIVQEPLCNKKKMYRPPGLLPPQHPSFSKQSSSLPPLSSSAFTGSSATSSGSHHHFNEHDIGLHQQQHQHDPECSSLPSYLSVSNMTADEKGFLDLSCALVIFMITMPNFTIASTCTPNAINI